MANPSGAAGTKYENHVRDKILVGIWPEAERRRLQGINDYGDFLNVGGWLIEAKGYTRTGWALPLWIRHVYRKLKNKHDHTDKPWAIIFKGDKRGELKEDYVVIPARIWLQLMKDHRDYRANRREHAKWKTGPHS
jgi:hypothetical protein